MLSTIVSRVHSKSAYFNSIIAVVIVSIFVMIARIVLVLTITMVSVVVAAKSRSPDNTTRNTESNDTANQKLNDIQLGKVLHVSQL